MLQLGNFAFLEVDESLLIVSDLVGCFCHMLHLFQFSLCLEELLLVVVFLFREQFNLVSQLL